MCLGKYWNIFYGITNAMWNILLSFFVCGFLFGVSVQWLDVSPEYISVLCFLSKDFFILFLCVFFFYLPKLLLVLDGWKCFAFVCRFFFYFHLPLRFSIFRFFNIDGTTFFSLEWFTHRSNIYNTQLGMPSVTRFIQSENTNTQFITKKRKKSNTI